MSNPYAPPRAAVQDFIGDPDAHVLHADRGTRLVAAFLDAIIFSLMVYVPLYAAGAFGSVADPEAAVESASVAALLLAAVGFVAYCALTIMLMRRNGQSMGKKIVGIKVVRSDGSPASLARLIWLRNVVNWLISLIPLYFLIDILFIFGEPRQCLHDKLADTIVIKA